MDLIPNLILVSNGRTELSYFCPLNFTNSIIIIISFLYEIVKVPKIPLYIPTLYYHHE